MKPVIVFDLDGTLVDSASAIRDVANALMAERGLRPLDLAETKSYIGEGMRVFLRRALTARGAYDEAAIASDIQRIEHFFRYAEGSANPPFPGADATLRHLGAEGYRLALCTNKPKVPTSYILEAHGWETVFASVIAGDMGLPLKPHPGPLLAAIEAAGGGAAIFVGDSEVDAATAVAAGVPLVLFTRGYRKCPVAEIAHAAAFDDFAELPGIIHGVGSRA
ncbi:MAG: phosphoglycolate phosphatase [Hyphomicrobiaceae bacterium]|nr:phosphoglycolate phosphatase [Hyphomicrobiaceae bacterium]